TLTPYTSALPTSTTTLSLHDALPILHTNARTDPHRKGQHPWQVTLADAQVNLAMVWSSVLDGIDNDALPAHQRAWLPQTRPLGRSEEHTSELQSRFDLVCRLLLEKTK